jgi:RHH-type transcriptional regulator, proline utilization regulon repressor / proline dehydrogenase / delta 1-pyrroline-5-carboxylate dehydrogenase
MALDVAAERSIADFESELRAAVESHPPLALTPAWFQQRLLDWATGDPDFRVKLLQFVDVLPTLRNTKAVADHVRQYFRDTHRPLIGPASELASTSVFRPILSQVVRQGVFAMAGRFIAGATPEEALDILRELARDGVGSTVDLLGEETLSDAEADAYLDRYLHLVRTLSDDVAELSPVGEQWANVPPVNISIKLSALCAHLEPAAPEWVSETARVRLRTLLRTAIERGAFVNFDVEQYRYRELVERAFADVLLEPEFRSHEHVGIVVQAYLRDAEAQIDVLHALAEERGTPFSVRLVKGAYWDEEQIVADQNGWPVPVYTVKQETDDSYDRCSDKLIAAWPHLRAAFGTHNPHSVAQAAVKAREAGLRTADIEFQMLYGMAEGLRRAVAKGGYRTRVYLPVGQVIPGMAYLVRRLLENTSNQAWFNAGASGVKLDGAGDVGSWKTEGGRHRDRLTWVENVAPARFFEPDVRARLQKAIDARRAMFGKTYPLLLGGRELADRELAPDHYPATGETMALVAQGTRADVDEAVRIAREAFPGWRDTPGSERAGILRAAADLVEERRYELAAVMVFESGKPWHEADGDVCEAADYLRYYAAQAEALETPVPMGGVAGEHNEYFHQGRGVAAIIAPWNFPLAIICGMSVGAIAGGNAAILKPAGESPVIAHELVRILREAGVPAGIAQFLPGAGGEVGQALVEHAGVDMIAFTGSSEVGLGIIEAAAKMRPGQENVKRVIAEMGGKNAIIVDEDADLDQAVSGVIASAFGYAGQKCSACSRLVIVGSAYEETVARLKNAVESLVVGPPERPETFVPPVISEKARAKIQGYVDGAMSYATLLAQGPEGEAGGAYVRPTVFVDVPLDSALAREEVFGPVLAVFRAETFAEALVIAMDSRFALTGGVFSRNPRNIELAWREFRVGNLYINRKVTGAVVARQPFGGMRLSGNAEKAGGPDYVRQLMEARTVTENLVRRGFAPDEGQERAAD